MQHAGESVVEGVVVYRRELEVDGYRLVFRSDIAQVRQDARLDMSEVFWPTSQLSDGILRVGTDRICTPRLAHQLCGRTPQDSYSDGPGKR